MPTRIFLQSSYAALCGNPITAPSSANANEQHPLPVSAVRITEPAAFRALVAAHGSADSDTPVNASGQPLTASEAAALKGSASDAASATSPLGVETEVFRLRLFDLYLAAATAAANAKSTSSSVGATPTVTLTPGVVASGASSGIITVVDGVECADRAAAVQVRLSTMGVVTALADLAFATSSSSDLEQEQQDETDPLTSLTAQTHLRALAALPRGLTSLSAARVPQRLLMSLLTDANPFAVDTDARDFDPALPPAAALTAAVAHTAATSVPALSAGGDAVAAAVARALCEFTAAAAARKSRVSEEGAALAEEDAAAVVGLWYARQTRRFAVPAVFLAGNLIRLLTELITLANNTAAAVNANSPEASRACPVPALALLLPGAETSAAHACVDALPALLSGYARLPQLQSATAVAIAAACASPQGLLWGLSSSTSASSSGSVTVSAPLAPLLGLALAFDDDTRATAHHALASMLKPVHAGNAAAALAQVYIFSLLAAPQPPADAALARAAAAVRTATADPEAVAGPWPASSAAAGAEAEATAGVETDIAAALPHAISHIMRVRYERKHTASVYPRIPLVLHVIIFNLVHFSFSK